MKRYSRMQLFLLLVILLAIALNSGCSFGNEPAATHNEAALPAQSAILTPAQDGLKVLLGSPVQVQSVMAANQAISKVELWVQNENEATEQLIHADTLNGGLALQEWLPQQVGKYTLKVRAWDSQNQAQADLIRQVEVVKSSAIASDLSKKETLNTEAEAASFGAAQVDLTPTPAPVTASANDVQIQVVQQTVPEPTQVPRYPAPGSAPGVPPGPTQAELNNFGPPICEAAEYLGVYQSDTSRRIMITEDDDIPAKTVGGTVIHRAWRIRNIGTCTWGPGYELAFYGGRAMGSGGVAFESVFPAEPPRRNTVIDRERLIMPEGKPNETAVIELALTAPTTPGIHQSYWRMRDPHGVYFGPIVGVTLEVVRDCEFGVYGAPVINRFEIIGVGNVYNPVDPIHVNAVLNSAVTLDWDILNASNFDIVFESPTGRVESTTTTDSVSRATFSVKELGSYNITLYADNGSCTVKQEVKVEVIPPSDQQFVLNVALPGTAAAAANSGTPNLKSSATLPTNATEVDWTHFDRNADKFTLLGDIYAEQKEPNCGLGYRTVPILGIQCPTYSSWKLADNVKLEVGGAGQAQGAATVSNVEESICQKLGLGQAYQIHYTLEAQVGNRAAEPQFSNTVVVNGRCGAVPTEIR